MDYLKRSSNIYILKTILRQTDNLAAKSTNSSINQVNYFGSTDREFVGENVATKKSGHDVQIH